MNKRKVAKLTFLASRLPGIIWQAIREARAVRVSRRTTLRDLIVLDYEIYETHEPVFAKIHEALGLLASLDPRRFDRLRQDVKYILVRNATGAQYWTLTRTCALSLPEVQRASSAAVALAIVHEGTHARLNSWGIFPYQRVRSRLERRCVEEELAFLGKLEAEGYGGVEAMRLWLASLLPADRTTVR